MQRPREEAAQGWSFPRNRASHRDSAAVLLQIPKPLIAGLGFLVLVPALLLVFTFRFFFPEEVTQPPSAETAVPEAVPEGLGDATAGTLALFETPTSEKPLVLLPTAHIEVSRELEQVGRHRVRITLDGWIDAGTQEGSNGADRDAEAGGADIKELGLIRSHQDARC